MSSVKQQIKDQADQFIQKQVNNMLETEKNRMKPEEVKALQDEFRGKLEVLKSDNLAIKIPAGMDKMGAAIELFQMYKESESKQSYNYDFKNRYYVDSLYIIRQALIKHLGRISPIPHQHRISNEVVSFDSNGVPVRAEIFEGVFTVPAFEDAELVVYATGTMEVVLKTDELKKKFEPELRKMVAYINEELTKSSLYEGSCVKIKTSKSWNGGDIWSFDPFFNKANPGIILNPSEESVVSEYIIPELNLKGKRAYLFCGGYGNGKTETAMRIGEVATQMGYLFAYVKSTKDFTKVLSLSRNYTKLLIFMEDLDELASGEQRGEIINNVLNTLDGIDSKNSNVKVIFTTNHEKKLNPALRRPGRLDLIINFDDPEIGTACRIVEYQFNKHNVNLNDDIDIEAGIEMLAAFSTRNKVSGAVVAEVANRAVRMFDLHGEVSQARFLACINSIKTQVVMMEEDVEEDHYTVLARATEMIGNHLAGARL